MSAHTHTLTSDYTREAPLSPPAFLGSTVSVTPCGTSDTRSTAASLHSSSWLSSACWGKHNRYGQPALMRPKRLIDRGLPMLGAAWGLLALALKEASGEPAGRGLCHLRGLGCAFLCLSACLSFDREQRPQREHREEKHEK